MRIVFCGMVAGDPHQGGASWAVLQYVLGLRALGHDVMLIEPVGRLEDVSSRYFRDEIVKRFELGDRAVMLVESTRATVGPSYRRVVQFARHADLLINVSGMLRDPDLRSCPVTAYLDLDPAFNQLWHEVEHLDVGLDDHDRYVTVGLAIGSPTCPVPTCGRSWLTTMPPVVLDLWPPRGEGSIDAFTTIGNWRAYGSIVHDGVHYGQKAHSLRELAELPRRTSERLLLAFAIHSDEHQDLELLQANGWELTDPRRVAGDPERYATFVGGSKAEIAIAKSGYVKSRCGWFSDRSGCYLASGRPVLAQDTGLGTYLPTGEGFVTFQTTDQAGAGMEHLMADYRRHARAARQLAEEFLDSRTVLSRLLEELSSRE